MTPLSSAVRAAIARDPKGQRLVPGLLEVLPHAHWGARRAPGRLRVPAEDPLGRDVRLPRTFLDWAAAHPAELDGPIARPDEDVHLDCVIETDRVVLALEDATAQPLETGTVTYGARHRLSRVIEALRVLAAGRLFGVGVIAAPGFVEPSRAAILEGLPHLEREEAEDLYAAYWGWCTPQQVREVLDAIR